MKLLLTKGILTTHPPICDCDGCRISSPVPQGQDQLQQQLVTQHQMVSSNSLKFFDYEYIMIKREVSVLLDLNYLCYI